MKRVRPGLKEEEEEEEEGSVSIDTILISFVLQ